METQPPKQLDHATTSKVISGPKALSLRQKAQLYPRLRLIVEPILWTMVHLELLQCTISQPFVAASVAKKLDYPSDDNRRKTFEKLSCSRKYRDREDAVRFLMGGPDGPLKTFSGLDFCFGKDLSITLPCSYFCLRDECGAGNVEQAIPIVAHIDRDHILSMQRQRRFQSQRPHRPGTCMVNGENWRPVPKEQSHEPYLVALLIALARQQWQMSTPSRRKQVSGVEPKVLCTASDGKDSIHLYSANISSTLIDMFNDPNLSPAFAQSLQVQITTIAYKPFGTLRDRLMELVLPATILERLDGPEEEAARK